MDSPLIADTVLANTVLANAVFANPLLASFSWEGLLVTLYNIFKVLAGVGFVIFVHELGHFLAAKFCGVKCEKFYVGFDPPMKFLPSALFRFQWGETEYGIGIIPLGGYVKMLGQDDNPARQAEEAERSKVVTTGEDGEERVELDPRSYVAKSVPQRMLIISAGVIMNLIFAVIMAAVAYRSGALFLPVEIATATAGDPAWVQGMQAGDKVLQIGKEGTPDEHLRWKWEFQNTIIKSGIRKSKPVEPLDFLVRNYHNETRWVHLLPTTRGIAQRGSVVVGVRPANANRLSAKQPTFPFSAAADASPPFAGGDRIIKFNGQPLDDTHANLLGDIPSTELEQLFYKHIDESVVLTVERKGEGDAVELVDITVPPQPLKTLGLVMEIGPLAPVRIGSPAEGVLLEGDILLQINGAPVGDPMTLPQRMPSGELTIQVRREGELQEVALTTIAPDARVANLPLPALGSFVGLETIGAAYSVTRTVAAVAPNSKAAEADIQPGDVVEFLQFSAEGEAHEAAVKLLGKKYSKSIELNDDYYNWPWLNDQVQVIPSGVKLNLTLVRQEKKRYDVELEPQAVEGQFYYRRGLALVSLDRVHRAENWGDAFSLGMRETREKFFEVLDVVGLLFTGQLSPKNLGGPIMIAAAAGSEASLGIPRLLLFLTFLSVNLAILNFLPIPVLDGGHFVFLLWEWVRGRPVSERVQNTLMFIGFCALMLLMVYVFTNDIRRLFG